MIRDARSDGTTPIVLVMTEPTYTPEATVAKLQGEVILHATIRADGRADDMTVEKSLEPGLDVNAIECARHWRFRPAYKDGKPIPAAVTLIVRFRLL